VIPDLAGAERALARLGSPLGLPLVVLAEATSTNDLAKAAAREGAPHGATWVADRQTAGRGRQGRVWSSPAGENLLFSVLLRTPCALPRLPLLSLAAGLAVRDVVAAELADDARVLSKWPNDVLVRPVSGGAPKKIAGILVESMLSGNHVEAIVVGIGLNVHTRVFPAELADRATSLALEGARDPSRAALLAAVLAGLDRDVSRVAAKGLATVHERLVLACALRGNAVTAGDVEGTCEGVDTDGRLMVRTAAGELVRLTSGEAHLGSVGA